MRVFAADTQYATMPGISLLSAQVVLLFVHPPPAPAGELSTTKRPLRDLVAFQRCLGVRPGAAREVGNLFILICCCTMLSRVVRLLFHLQCCLDGYQYMISALRPHGNANCRFQVVLQVLPKHLRVATVEGTWVAVQGTWHVSATPSGEGIQRTQTVVLASSLSDEK